MTVSAIVCTRLILTFPAWVIFLVGCLALPPKGYHIVFTGNTPKLKIVAEDSDDNKFIECAVALGSGFIISGDKALLAVKNYMGIKILSPHEFLRINT